jgi:hypothetical protein
MSDPYWNGADWSPDATYVAGDKVSYEGYRYEAMTGISAGDNPRTATYKISGATFRKWKVWDYPASYIMARLRGIPGHAEVSLPGEVRLVQVRADYQYNADPAADLYLTPSGMSAAAYGMPQGMNSTWGAPDNGELVWSFSAAAYDDGKPKSYDYNVGADQGIVFSPTTILPRTYPAEPYPGVIEITFTAAYSYETQGQLISCYQTFDRIFNYLNDLGNPSTITTSPFEDNWTAGNATNGDPSIGDIIGTIPDYKDG